VQPLAAKTMLCAGAVFVFVLGPFGSSNPPQERSELLAVAAPCVWPTLVAPDVVAPTAVAPALVAPTEVAPAVVAPTEVAPTIVAPAIVAPTVVSPTIVAPTVVETCTGPGAAPAGQEAPAPASNAPAESTTPATYPPIAFTVVITRAA
jgi:hypothetical protein